MAARIALSGEPGPVLLDIPKDKIPPVNKIYDFTLAHQVNAELDASHWKPSK